MRSERNASARPMRRRLRHLGRMPYGGEKTKAGGRFVQTVAHIAKAGIAAMHAIDAAELAQPMAGLRERNSDLPRTAPLGATLERRHDRECQQIAGGMVERLRRQGARLGRTERVGLGKIQSACRLHERIEAAARRPWTGMAVGGEPCINHARAQPGDLRRTKSKRGESAGPVALDEDVRVP